MVGPTSTPTGPTSRRPTIAPTSVTMGCVFPTRRDTTARTTRSTTDGITLPNTTMINAAPTRPCTSAATTAGTHTSALPTTGTNVVNPPTIPQNAGAPLPITRSPIPI